MRARLHTKHQITAFTRSLAPFSLRAKMCCNFFVIPLPPFQPSIGRCADSPPTWRRRRVFRKQCAMAALLRDLSLAEDENVVRILHRGQPVGDHQHRFVPGQRLKGLLNLVLVLRVGEGGGLVQHHDGGVLQNGPGQGDALLLPAGEVDAPGAYHRVQPLGQLFRMSSHWAAWGSGKHLLPGGVRPGGPDIFQQALLEQPGILEHKGHLSHEGGAVQLPHIRAASVTLRCPHPRTGGSGWRRWSCPRRWGPPGPPPVRADGKAHILQRGPVRAGVGEGHMVKRPRRRPPASFGPPAPPWAAGSVISSRRRWPRRPPSPPRSYT